MLAPQYYITIVIIKIVERSIRVFTEELSKIKHAEDKADALRKEARQEAKAIIEGANTKANQIILEAETSARSVYDGFLKDGEEQADKEQESALKLAVEESKGLGAQALKHQNDAIRFIKERTGKA